MKPKSSGGGGTGSAPLGTMTRFTTGNILPTHKMHLGEPSDNPVKSTPPRASHGAGPTQHPAGPQGAADHKKTRQKIDANRRKRNKGRS